MPINQLKNILIVDDEPTCRRVLQMAFKTKNVGNILTAQNSEEAIKIINDNKLDLIVTDLHLGDDDSGFEICKIIKENKNLKHIPIISVSAFNKIEAKPKKYSDLIDSDFHFKKPFNMLEIIKLSKELLFKN